MVDIAPHSSCTPQQRNSHGGVAKTVAGDDFTAHAAASAGNVAAVRVCRAGLASQPGPKRGLSHELA